MSIKVHRILENRGKEMEISSNMTKKVWVIKYLKKLECSQKKT